MMNPITLSLPGNSEMQDRVEVFRAGPRVIFALADGAGGMSGGARAAELVMARIGERSERLVDATACEEALLECDRLISEDPLAGETTGVVLVAEGTKVFGASVGDSQAWVFSATGIYQLTCRQFRKPLLGSGECIAVGFSMLCGRELVVVASDGLWKYTAIQKIAAECGDGEIATLPERLAGLVRLRSGALPDDLALGILQMPVA